MLHPDLQKRRWVLPFQPILMALMKKYGKPILPGSHEVFIWSFNNGVAALASISSTLEFVPDGIDFLTVKKELVIDDRPNTPGAFRPDLTQLQTLNEGIHWGISMIHNGSESYLVRFTTVGQ